MTVSSAIPLDANLGNMRRSKEVHPGTGQVDGSQTGSSAKGREATGDGPIRGYQSPNVFCQTRVRRMARGEDLELLTRELISVCGPLEIVFSLNMALPRSFTEVRYADNYRHILRYENTLFWIMQETCRDMKAIK